MAHWHLAGPRRAQRFTYFLNKSPPCPPQSASPRNQTGGSPESSFYRGTLSQGPESRNLACGGGSGFWHGGPAESRGLPDCFRANHRRLSGSPGPLMTLRAGRGPGSPPGNGGTPKPHPPPSPTRGGCGERNAARFFAASAAPSRGLWGTPPLPPRRARRFIYKLNRGPCPPQVSLESNRGIPGIKPGNPRNQTGESPESNQGIPGIKPGALRNQTGRSPESNP